MKITSILLTVAALSAFGMASIPSASAQAAPAVSAQHPECKDGFSYDVKKGKCAPTVGATSYSPKVMHKHHKKHLTQTKKAY